jgi:hypothetical protein
LASSASAFAPSGSIRSATQLNAAEVDSTGNNIAVKNLLTQVEASSLLTKVAEAGLLSKAQKAGITLSGLEPLLKEVSDSEDILILLEAAGPEALPILPKVIDLAPGALPLLAAAVQISPGALQGAAVASLAAAAGAVYAIPDDTVAQVAAQTLLGGTLGVAAPAACVIGSAVIGKIKK